ncbi:PucR family transcriptional regulator [Amycolatopsis jejuensis]|uniref:PucR family transcriptional regulator n=1 Tax=Amycolatopsis jejuensis TaxID=330084 RepID=UPI00138E2E9C|nr:helix-turn-helix domain-containing protein [Amycolatopsis jejuensis]
MPASWKTQKSQQTPVDTAWEAAVTIGADAESVASRHGADALRWAESVGCEAAARISGTVPDLGSNAAHLRLIRRAIVSTVLRGILLLDGEPVELITTESREAVRDFVRRGLQLTGIFRAIRVGQACIIEHFVAAEEAPGETAGMRRVLSVLLAAFDSFTGAIEAEFWNEYENGMAATAATRIQTVNQVLSGAFDGPRASRALGYPLDRPHVGIVAWSSGESGSAGDAAVRRAVTELLAALGTHHTLLVPVGAGAMWAWGTAPERIKAAPVLPPEVEIAVGEPGEGAAGFRATHGEARAVERLLQVAERADKTAVTFHRDAALAILMAADPDSARVFLRRVLGDLLEDNPRMHEIRTTVRCYLDEGRSLTKTAERLQIAKNTVTYRVHRAEELSGSSLGTEHLFVHAALMLSDYLGTGRG